MDRKQYLESLKELKKSISEVSVYGLDVHTAIELYYILANKQNELISSFGTFTEAITDEVITQNEEIQYMKTEGLNLEVVTKIDKMVSDGTFDKLLNGKLLLGIKSQLNEKAKQIDLEIERARIDNLSSLSVGSTTGDAELIDGRIGADGVTYTNIGESIRTQVKGVKNQISKIKITDNIMKNKFLYGKGVFTSGTTQGSTITLGGDGSNKGRTPYFYKPTEAIGFILEPKVGYNILLISTYDKSKIEELWADNNKTKVVTSSDDSLLYMFKCTKIDGGAIDTSEIPFKLTWVYEDEEILKDITYNASQIKNVFESDSFRFSMLSKLVRGGLLNGEIYYGMFTDYYCKRNRVVTEDIIKFTRECKLQINPNYRIGVHYYENGVFSKDSGWITSDTFTIPKGSECRVIISRKDEDNNEIADIKEFDSAVSVIYKPKDNTSNIVINNYDFRDTSYIKEIFSASNPKPTEFLQGGCSDGEHLYYCFTYNSWGLHKFNIKSKQVVKTIDKDSGGGYYAHANDLAYDSLNDLLVVAYTTHDTITLAKINKDTLQSIGTLALTNESGTILKAYGIGYNIKTNQFYVGEEGNFSKLYVYDSDFNQEKIISLSKIPPSTSSDYLHQCIECDGNYIYLLFSNPNCIYVYDLEGNFIKSINIVTDYEVESISHDGNGNFYIMANVHNSNANSYKVFFSILTKHITAEGVELLIK